MKKLSEFYSIIINSTNSKSVVEIGWVAIGQGVNIILSLLIVKIISQMGPKDYGVYALILTFSALISLIYGSFQQGFIRYYYDYKKENKDDIFINLFFKFLKITIIFLLIIVFIFSIFSKTLKTEYSIVFFLIAGVMIITTKVSELFNSWFNIIRKRKTNSVLLSGEKGLMVIFLIFLLLTNNLSLKNILIFIALSSLIFIVIKLITFKKYIPQKNNCSEYETEKIQNVMRKRVWGYSTPFLIWACAGWLQLNGEKWIINGILSVTQVGIYAIMMAVVNALIVIPINVINEFATPIIYQNFADLRNFEKIKKGYTYINIIILLVLGLSIISTIITYFFAEDLILLISSKKYISYWYLLPLLTFGTGMFYLGQTQTLLGMALDMPKKYLSPKILIGVFAIIFNLIFIKAFGLNGVAYTIILIGLLYVIHITLINRKMEDVFYKKTN